MSKWLILAAVALLLAWGPFLYAELTSEPVEKKARDLPTERLERDEPVEILEPEPDEELPAVAEAEEPPDEPAVATQALEGSEAAQAEGKPVHGEAPELQQAVEPGDPEAVAEPLEDELGQQEQALSTAEGAPDEEAESFEDAPLPPASGPTAVFKQAFDSEPRDALWASETEQRIASLFSAEELPADMLRHASCRKAVCRIELQWSPEQAEGYARLYQALSDQFGQQIGVEPLAEAEPQSAQVFVYVLREGYALQDLQQ